MEVKRYVALSVITATVIALPTSFNNDEPADKAELGKLLFFNPILSKDKSISCASCHKPEYAFADTSATSIGVGGLRGIRNTLSAMNVAVQRVWKNRHWRR